MKDRISLDEIIQDNYPSSIYDERHIRKCMREAIRQALEIGAEKAIVSVYHDEFEKHTIVDKASITNVLNLVE